MSNLPVLWVPPVAPPDPDERPPKRRGNGGVLLAAAAILCSGLAIVAVRGAVWPHSEAPDTPKTAALTDTSEALAASNAAAPVPLPKPMPSHTVLASGPSPETSGGNQPYIAPPQPPVSASEAKPGPRSAVGPDGRPVRVIGIERPSADMAQGEPSRDIVERRTKDDDAPPRVASPVAARVPLAPEPAPSITAAAPRGTIDEAPSAPEPRGAAPVPATPRVATPSPLPPQVVAPLAPAPTSPSVVRVEPPTATPKEGNPPPAPVTASAEPVPEPEPEIVPLPPKRVAPPPSTARAATAGREDDFADRLAAIRRAEGRRAVEARPVEPMIEDDEEEIVVAPRRRWGFVPPIFDDRPRGAVLRPYEAPPRVVSEREASEDNCHYHAWPTEEMAFHRTVRCHWHRDPGDPSIRYVR